MKQIMIRVDQERLGDLVTVDEFIGLQEGNVRCIRDVLANFVVNGTGYLSPEEGRKIIGGMSLNQLKDAAAEFARKAQETAVPKESGAS